MRIRGILAGLSLVVSMLSACTSGSGSPQATSEVTPQKSTTPGLADPAAVALVDSFIAAHNTNDAATVAAQYGQEASLHACGPLWGWLLPHDRRVPKKLDGFPAIRDFYRRVFDQSPKLLVERVSPVLQVGPRVSFVVHEGGIGYPFDQVWIQGWSEGKIWEAWNCP